MTTQVTSRTPTEADALAARAETPAHDTALADIRNALAIIEGGRVEFVGAPRYTLASREIEDVLHRLVAAETKLEREAAAQ